MRQKILEAFLNAGRVCTDTRNIIPGSIFFALKGANFNGNEFALAAIEQGCEFAVIDEAAYSGPRCILVDDVLTSLQELAYDYRMTFDIPFLAITGSNGKTTTKELVAAVLEKKFKVHFTQGNFNNHIGVPLTLLSMSKDTEFAVIEMGANHQREIAALAEIAAPDYGLITNIGKAHLEGFGGIQGVKKGKGELYDFLREHDGKILVNQSTQFLSEMAEGIRSAPYYAEGGPLKLDVVETNPTVAFTCTLASKPIQTNLTGAYNMNNFATAIAVGQEFGVANADIVSALEEYMPTNQRSQIHKTDRNTIILDAYNANPSSMSLALANLAKMEADKKFFIIGDMLELGDESEAEHAKIIQEAEALNLQGILVGSEFGEIGGHSFVWFDNGPAAEAYLNELTLENQLILLKGSRGIKLETLLDSL